MRRAMARYTGEYAALRKRLRAAREKAGLSQSEAARRLGKPQSFVWKSEVGERRVDAVELRAFARLYGVTLTYFFDDR